MGAVLKVAEARVDALNVVQALEVGSPLQGFVSRPAALPDTRGWAIAVGRERVRLGPVPAAALAEAIVAAHRLLGPAPQSG